LPGFRYPLNPCAANRLHSAIGYIAPADKIAGKAEEIFAMRELKLEQARSKKKKIARHTIAA
jgi:hypothetical protein